MPTWRNTLGLVGPIAHQTACHRRTRASYSLRAMPVAHRQRDDLCSPGNEVNAWQQRQESRNLLLGARSRTPHQARSGAAAFDHQQLSARAASAATCASFVSGSALAIIRIDQHADALMRPALARCSSSSRFATSSLTKKTHTGGVAARVRQAIDKAGTNRIGRYCKHDRYRARRLQQRSRRGAAICEDDVRCEGCQFPSVSVKLRGVGCGPPRVEAHIAADIPAEERQRLHECSEADLK